MAYRYNKDLPAGFVEGDNRSIVKDEASYNSLKAEETKRYEAANPPKPDPVTEYYAGIKNQAVMPDEARRQALRGEAEREIQTQLTAINNAYATLISDERARQGKLAAQGAAQVTGISRLSGLGGSSVASQRAETQSQIASENERRAVAVYEAQQARDIASARGASVSEADSRFRQEQTLAQNAQGQYGQYLQSLAKSSSAPIEVGGYLVDKNGKVIFAPPGKETGYEKVGDYLVDPKTGKVIFAPPDKVSEPKTFTLNEGQRVFSADGKVIAEYTKGSEPKTLTLSPGQIAYNEDGTVFATGGSSPASASKTELIDLGNGKKALINSLTGETIKEYQGSAKSPTGQTEQIVAGGKKLLVDSATGEVIKDFGPVEDPIIQQKKTEEKAATREEIINSGKQKLALINDIEKNKAGVAGAVSVYALGRFLKSAGTADKAEKVRLFSAVEQLMDLEALAKLIEVKAQGGTFGALSDKELAILKNASNQLNSWALRDKQNKIYGFEVAPNDFYKELQKMKEASVRLINVNSQPEPETSEPEQDPLDAELDKLGFEKLGSASQNALKTLTIGNREVRVAPQIALRLARAANDFKQATGQELQINQDFRTHEEQARLYKELSAKGARVAPPGHSWHEKGLAIDVTNWKAAEPYLRRYGLTNNLADDRGHFSFREG